MKRAALLGLLLLAVPHAGAQIPGLPKPRIPGVESIPGLDSIFKKGPAITTSIKDAKYADPSADGFSPEAKDLFTLQRGPNGGFILQAGTYGATLQSYCLHAGTHGPTSGDGYLDAPVKGPFWKFVTNVARRSVQHPEIEQHDVQTLLWALVARSKTSDLTGGTLRAANALLTSDERFEIDGGALGLLSDSRFSQAFGGQPPLLRQIYEAEARLRSALSGPNVSYGELERIAVLTGDAALGPGSKEVPTGRWSKLPQGYSIRFMPVSYPTTRLEITVPEGSKAIGTEFDPSEHIAAPANTAKQRLLQSARRKDEEQTLLLKRIFEG